MPRTARFRIAALDELFRQLRFAPRETRLRQMNAAEALIEDIDPRRTYPTDFIIFRITGYRPDRVDDSPLLVGEALIGDLVVLVQRLSEALNLPADYAGRRAITVEEVARRLSISGKTLQRYRRRGLVCHYVVFPDPASGDGLDEDSAAPSDSGSGPTTRRATGLTSGGRLACFDDAVQRFVRQHRDALDRAATFTRIERSAKQGIIEAARALRAEGRISLNEAALRLAREHGRAHETVRRLLRRHDRRAERPIFAEHGPLTERDARLIHRAARWGISATDLAAHFGKTPATIRRAFHRRRADLLRAMDVRAVELPTFSLVDAEAVILASPAVTRDLDNLLPRDDALELIEQAHAALRAAADEETEAALLAGYNLLKHRARAKLDALPAWPGATVLDRIETDLRWATRLKRRLVSRALPSALRCIEQYLHRPLVTQPADRIAQLLTRAVHVASGAIETLDPSHGGRLERRTTYEMDRALARPGPAPAGPKAGSFTGRAAARHEPGAVRLDDAFFGVTAWEEILELRGDLAAHVPELADPPLEELIRLHYSLASTPPVTCAALAERLGISPSAVGRRLHRGERALLKLARAARRPAR
jgi:RNA polymerase primary sigma factor